MQINVQRFIRGLQRRMDALEARVEALSRQIPSPPGDEGGMKSSRISEAKAILRQAQEPKKEPAKVKEKTKAGADGKKQAETPKKSGKAPEGVDAGAGGGEDSGGG